MTRDEANRKLAELLGWRVAAKEFPVPQPVNWRVLLKPDGRQATKNIYRNDAEAWKDAPDFFSPSESEGALERACDEHGLSWELHRTIVGKFICIITEVSPEGSEEEISNKLGDTPSEARCNALIAALALIEKEGAK